MIGDQVQQAIYAALTGASIAAGRVYDQVPANPVFPYVTIGDEQVLDESTGCGAAWEVFVDIHCWSRPVAGSKLEVKALAATVVTAILGIASVAGHLLVGIEHQTTRVFRDPDGKTEHAAITIRALIDPA